jgi:hypothetical protein
VFQFHKLNSFERTSKKVKLSYYRSGKPLGLEDVETARISGPSAHEGGKVVRPMNRPPLPPRRNIWYSFLLEA